MVDMKRKKSKKIILMYLAVISRNNAISTEQQIYRPDSDTDILSNIQSLEEVPSKLYLINVMSSIRKWEWGKLLCNKHY